MVQATEGSLVMIGLNTSNPKVFWNGALIPNITGILIDNGPEVHKVVLNMQEDNTVAELKAAGISVRRV